MSRNKTFATGYSVNNLVKMGYDDDIIVEGILASNDRDVQGDVIDPSFLKQMTQGLNSNAPVFLNHFYHRPAIGKVLKAEYVEDSKSGKAHVWGRVLIDTKDEEVKKQVADQRLRYFSVGGHLKDYDVEKGADGRETRHCKGGDILELSLTAVPINVSAGMTLAKAQEAQLLENVSLIKSIINMDEEEQSKITKLNYHDVQLIPIQSEEMDMNRINKGDVSQFHKLSDKPSKSEIDFGHGTQVSSEDTEKFFKPEVSAYKTKDVDVLNVPDQHSQEFLGKHKSQVATDQQKVDDFGFVDENSDRFLNKTKMTSEATINSAPNNYDESNSVDPHSNQWILSQAKTFVSGLDNLAKSVIVDLILHDFDNKELYQTNRESLPQTIHRFLHQKDLYAKSGGIKKMIDEEIIGLLKSVPWESADNNMYDRILLDHVLGPYHIDEVHQYMKAALPEETEEMYTEEPEGYNEPVSEQPTPEMQTQEDGGMEGEVADIVIEFGKAAQINPEQLEQMLQGGDVVNAAQEVLGTLEQSNPEMAEQMKEAINEVLTRYDNQVQGGDVDPSAGPSAFGKAQRVNIKKAVTAAYKEARREQLQKSRIAPQMNGVPLTHGKPVSAADMQMAGFMSQYTT